MTSVSSATKTHPVGFNYVTIVSLATNMSPCSYDQVTNREFIHKQATILRYQLQSSHHVESSGYPVEISVIDKSSCSENSSNQITIQSLATKKSPCRNFSYAQVTYRVISYNRSPSREFSHKQVTL